MGLQGQLTGSGRQHKAVLPEQHKAVLPVGETVQDPRSAERPGNALVLPWMTLQEVSDGREVWTSLIRFLLL